ncbi:DUF4157 domain-containing protein [Haloarcula sp. CBA1130]|nr:DUF4157 domain-containing protein [Haloarcula sp. CBA1130]KAA9400005.1 DUF4157 domain-containing protein [Haloarcula sp. CBA1129]
MAKTARELSNFGNQAVQRQLSEGSKPSRRRASGRDSSFDDTGEQEAECVADAVVGSRETGPEATSAPETGARTVEGTPREKEAANRVRGELGTGQRLPEDTRSVFESRLGANLDHVRVHTGSRAISLADELGARAFTVGSDVAFAAGEYEPTGRRGQRLLAHELTHVAQQTAAGTRGQSVGAAETIQRYPDGDLVEPLRAVMRAIRPEVVVDTDPADSVPSPNYDQTLTDLGALEQATLKTRPEIDSAIRETTDDQGTTKSYVERVEVDFRARYEYHIAKRFDPSQHRGTSGTAGTFRDIRRLIDRHATEHFVRFDAVLTRIGNNLREELADLPSRVDPVGVSRGVLREYVRELVEHYRGKLDRAAWEATCEWEREDYAALAKRIDSLPGVNAGTITVDCGNPPAVPQKPSLLSGSSGHQGSGSGGDGSSELEDSDSDPEGNS